VRKRSCVQMYVIVTCTACTNRHNACCFRCVVHLFRIIARAESLGEDWHQHVADFESSMDELQAHYDALLNSQVVATTPDYYKSPFHAYKEGNLNWQVHTASRSACASYQFCMLFVSAHRSQVMNSVLFIHFDLCIVNTDLYRLRWK
jgi:hypothetical protein